MTVPAIEQWFEFMSNGDAAILNDLLAEDVLFYSPAVHTPKRGREITATFLLAAEHLFSGTDFHYVAQWFGERSAVLEFAVELDGMTVEGVDIVHWNDQDRITSFKVMVRPFKGLQAVSSSMAATLEGMRPPPVTDAAPWPARQVVTPYAKSSVAVRNTATSDPQEDGIDAADNAERQDPPCGRHVGRPTSRRLDHGRR